jgi:hypothetical protein
MIHVNGRKGMMSPQCLRAPWHAAALVLALAAPPAARAQEAAGYVATVRGTWFTSARPDQPVSAGRVVAQGEEVWAAPRSSAGAYLTLVLRDGSRLALNCAVPGDCDRRHTLRVRAGLLERTERMVEAVLGLVRRDPEAFVSLISRAEGAGPEDVVAAPGALGIDVSEALKEMDAGLYQVALERWTPPGTGTNWMTAQGTSSMSGPPPPRNWAPGQPLTVVAMPPGLYVLRLESYDGGGGESWVLVPPPQEYARIREEFARAREMVSTWTGMDAAHDARVFLRAYLAWLAGAVPPAEAPR